MYVYACARIDTDHWVLLQFSILALDIKLGSLSKKDSSALL